MTSLQANLDVAITAATKTAVLTVSGRWLLNARRPMVASVKQQLDASNVMAVHVVAESLTRWDSTLVSYLLQLQRFCVASNRSFTLEAMPPGVQRLLDLATAVEPITTKVKKKAHHSVLQWLFVQPWQLLQDAQPWQKIQHGLRDFTEFIGLVSLALYRLIRGQAKTRWSDVMYFIDQAGPKAIGIITLTSILVGMIMAYLGSVQLRQFGAQIYVANLVALGMTREMGALMTAVVMSGRTGAAYAAQLGTMQTNDEIDAITTLGISPVEFLVLPRMLALIFIMPLLTLYSMVLGIVGGAFVAMGMGISMDQYITQLQDAVDFYDITTGLIKALVFGLLIATAGCQAGLQSGRSSAAVGVATTRAVVAAIVYLIVADTGLNIIYEKLGI